MRKTKKPTKETPVWKKVGACLYRYKGGTYYAVIKFRGKQIRQSLETEDKELARRKLTGLRRKLENTDPTLSRRTLADHRETFEALITGKEATTYSERLNVRKLVEQWPEDAPDTISKIKRSHVLAWLKPFRESLSASSINHLLTTARRFFDLAVADGVIERSPLDGIKYAKISKPIRNTPTEEQFRALVDDIRSQKSNGHGCNDSADFVELAGTLGLGQAELSAIRRQDIDLQAGIIRIFRRKTSQTFTVPIFPDARPIIERRLKNMPEEPEARLLPQDNCRMAMHGACKRLKFPYFEPRSLRRFHITRSLRAGIDAPTVAAWQGHRDGGALVLKTYQAEVNLSHSLRMAAMLGAKPENVVELAQQQAAVAL
ncbi:MAG: hypothetical protein FGM15_07115 [Chthoniobacterales bacterium]|nr:hypothetical protein [Chthoniobacterales bacterium]